MTTVSAPPVVRSRSFAFRTATEWLGRRNGRLTSEERESFVISSPPQFHGEHGFWTPEDLFVATVETCLMLTFVALVEKHHLPVEAYYSEATGTLELADGNFRFTRIRIKPTILITEQDAAERTLKVLAAAHRDCLISNSITAEVTIEPDIELSASE